MLCKLQSRCPPEKVSENRPRSPDGRVTCAATWRPQERSTHLPFIVVGVGVLSYASTCIWGVCISRHNGFRSTSSCLPHYKPDPSLSRFCFGLGARPAGHPARFTSAVNQRFDDVPFCGEKRNSTLNGVFICVDWWQIYKKVVFLKRV